MISVGAQKVLQEMVAAESRQDFEDAKIVQNRLEARVGDRRTSAQVVLELLRHALIADVSDVKGAHRYSLNEDGRKAALNREYLPPELLGKPSNPDIARCSACGTDFTPQTPLQACPHCGILR